MFSRGHSSFVAQPTGSGGGVGTKVGMVTGGSVGLSVGLIPIGGGAVVDGPWPNTIGSSDIDVDSVTGEITFGLEVVREVHFTCGSPVVP